MSTGDPPHVLARFQSRGARVRELLSSSEAFADLCGDYEEVVAALARIGGGVLPEGTGRVAELQELREALATEIEQSLQDRVGESDAASC